MDVPGAFYAPQAREEKQILQIKSSKSVEKIRVPVCASLHLRLA
jgi:hypothetical protein